MSLIWHKNIIKLWLMITILSAEIKAMSIANNIEQANSRSINIMDLQQQIDDEDILDVYGSFMLNNMNQSINPCEDFYEYACGNWKNLPNLTEKQKNDTFLNSLHHALSDVLTVFLNTTTEVEMQQDNAEAKAKLFYNSCLKMNNDLSLGYQHILELPEFQNIPEHKNDTFDWMNINFMSKYDMFALLPLKTHYNLENRKIELMLSAPKLVLGNAEITNIMNLTRDFKISNGSSLQTAFETEFQEMLNFEKNLTASVNMRNLTERVTLGDFFKLHQADKLNWTRYFEVAFNGSYKNDWIIHNTLQDYHTLVHLLNKTSLQTLSTYIRWRTLLKFYYVWNPQPQNQENKTIQDTCREQTEHYFAYALVPWLIEHVYDEDRRADILRLAGQIKQVFYNFMDKNKWLDEETRSLAKTKLSAMDIKAGYTDELSHRETMNQVFAEVNLTNNWFKNTFAVEANRANLKLKSVNQIIIPPPMHIRQANAYYAQFLNEAFVAIGLAQFPFYHKILPISMKYGGIGHIVGHEIAHGFDSNCYLYNYEGKQRNWWTEASLRNFRERYRCLEAQYGRMVLNGVATNGSLTLGDNIADNVGTRMAYHAYWQSFGQRDGLIKPIPGIQFNNKQLFFLKFAQTWCSGMDVATKLQRMKTDAHAYEKFRVIGTLRNMPEFSEAFSCKLGANMNPLKKCILW